MWYLYTSGVQSIAHQSTATPPRWRFPVWVLGRCATPRATTILSPVHSVCQVTCTLLRQRVRHAPSTRIWPRESGAALQSTPHTTHVLHYDMHVPVRVGVSTMPVSHSDHTLHSTPSHRPVRRAVTCTRRCRCNSDTQHSRGACPGSLGVWPTLRSRIAG